MAGPSGTGIAEAAESPQERAILRSLPFSSSSVMAFTAFCPVDPFHAVRIDLRVVPPAVGIQVIPAVEFVRFRRQPVSKGNPSGGGIRAYFIRISFGTDIPLDQGLEHIRPVLRRPAVVREGKSVKFRCPGVFSDGGIGPELRKEKIYLPVEGIGCRKMKQALFLISPSNYRFQFTRPSSQLLTDVPLTASVLG